MNKKIKLLSITLAVILMSAFAFCCPNDLCEDLHLDHAAGCGSADYTKVEIIRIVNSPDSAAVDSTTKSFPSKSISGTQEIRVAVYWCNYTGSPGMGPTSISNVTLNIKNDAGQNLNGYPTQPNINPIATNSSYVSMTHTHYTTIYSFNWDTTAVANGGYQLIPTVNFQFSGSPFTKIGRAVHVLVKNNTIDDEEDELRLVIACIGDVAGKFDKSAIKTAIGGSFGIDNIYFIPTSINIMFGNHVLDAPNFITDCLSATKAQLQEWEGGTKPPGIGTDEKYKNTYFIILRSTNNEISPGELGRASDSQQVVPIRKKAGFYDETDFRPPLIRIEFQRIEDVVHGRSGNFESGYTINDMGLNKNFVNNIVIHEVGHALGLVDTGGDDSYHCPSGRVVDVDPHYEEYYPIFSDIFNINFIIDGHRPIDFDTGNIAFTGNTAEEFKNWTQYELNKIKLENDCIMYVRSTYFISHAVERYYDNYEETYKVFRRMRPAYYANPSSVFCSAHMGYHRTDVNKMTTR